MALTCSYWPGGEGHFTTGAHAGASTAEMSREASSDGGVAVLGARSGALRRATDAAWWAMGVRLRGPATASLSPDRASLASACPAGAPHSCELIFPKLARARAATRILRGEVLTWKSLSILRA